MKDFSRLVPLICGFLVVIDNVFLALATKCYDDQFFGDEWDGGSFVSLPTSE